MYDIERFKREKLSVNFETKEEYKAFIQCCIDNEVKMNDEIWWLNRWGLDDAVVCGFLILIGFYMALMIIMLNMDGCL